MTPLTLNTDRGIDGTPRVIAAGEIDISNIHVFTEALTTASEGNAIGTTRRDRYARG